MSSAKETNPKDIAALDKAPMYLVPPSVKVAMAAAFADGAVKYGPYNWRENDVLLSVYLSALERHLNAFIDGEEQAADSKLPHMYHVAACAAIIIDAQAGGNLIDDRPELGPAPSMLKEYQDRKN